MSTEFTPPEQAGGPVPEQEPTRPEDTAPPAAPARIPRNQHLKVPEPKNRQFTGRATEAEFNRINAGLQARKRGPETYDIVRFCLDMMNHIEGDIFQTFKTK